MSFTIQYRSKTSGGRDFLRSSTLDAETLTIGRAASCDVRLTDLGVSLHHARIVRRSEKQLIVETEENLPITINGRRATHGHVNVQRGGYIRIGPHRLRISAGDGENEGRIVILVERDEARPRDDADDVFSLAGKAPGKRMSSWAFMLLILAACLAWPIYTYFQYKDADRRPEGFHADTMWISGQMSDAHANLANDCQVCHVEPFVSVRDSACLDCHTDIPDHAEAPRMEIATPEPGQWDAFLFSVADTFNKPRMACVSCHLEHEGGGAMEPAPQQFCSDCHTDLDGRLTDTGLLNAHDFGDDHPQFRPRIMTQPDLLDGTSPEPVRISLDTPDLREDNGLKFPHDMHLSTTNGVARMAQRLGSRFSFEGSLDCQNCHVPTPDGTRFEPINMEANCQMCHSLAFDRIGGTMRTLRHGEPEMVAADIRAFYRSTSPRRPINLSSMSRRRPGDVMQMRTQSRYNYAVRTRPARAEGAIRAAFTEGGACFDCHTTQRTGSRAAPYDVIPVRQIGRYMHLGWFDHKAHEQEDCSSCHVAGESDSATDVLLPGIATCRDCHTGGERSLTRVTSTCAMCHSYHQDDAAPYLVRARQNRGVRPRQVRDYSDLWNRN